MKRSRTWLLALLSALTLMTISTLAVAEEHSDRFSGSVEIGATAVDVDDNPARVQEYTEYSSDDGVNFAPRLEMDYTSDNLWFSIESDTKGPRDQSHSLDLDFKRMLRLDGSYQALEYRQDQETLDQMGATGRDDIGGGQPTVTTDEIMAELREFDEDATAVGGGTLDYDPREAFEQEVNNDYVVTRREIENDASLTLPVMPNVTFHAGMRLETREGQEQAIGVTKCDSCHVSAMGKGIDETTEEYTFGATGKFGPVTVDYEYLTRDFTEDSEAPTRYYEPMQNGTAYNMLYPEPGQGGDFPLARTPDSEKDSHSVKARVDFTNNTVLTSSYVNSDIESSKAETQGEYELLDGDSLESEYESFGGKLATRLGENLRLSLRGSSYEIDVSDNSIYFPARDPAINPDGAAAWPGDDTDAWHSAEARKVSEIGLDGVYRLATATTLRLGYEYEEVDREEEEYGETETHTLKAALKTRFNRSLSGRASYEYQNIDHPLPGAHVGIAQGDVEGGAIQGEFDSGLWYYNRDGDIAGNATWPEKVWYWTDVYPNRQLESTSLPEDVHEVKLNGTWAAGSNMAANVFARMRMEENDSVGYEQDTYVPGASFWYAPNGKMNLTMAYTFNKQETENKACVGWYHG